MKANEGHDSAAVVRKEQTAGVAGGDRMIGRNSGANTVRHTIAVIKMRWLAALGLAFCACAAASPVVGAATRAGAPTGGAARGRICESSDPTPRDAGNPLDLANNPGSDPLNGAQLFVYGPTHGDAAGAIARLLGRDPASYPNDTSWTSFWQSVTEGALHHLIAANRHLAGEVHELAKIASEPTGQRLSSFSEGGGPGALFGQTEKLLCSNYSADPRSIPILSTYFLHPSLGGCPTSGQISAYGPTFRRRVSEVADAVGRRPVVFLLETDGLGSSSCMARNGGLAAWEGALRFEVHKLGSLPHAVTYIEAGYSDSNSVAYTAKALNAIGIGGIRGFYTNDTHNNWTINEVRWASAISRRTHGAHFIVNTASNGNGPKLNPHPATQGAEDLCNPPGRALGPKPTTHTGFKLVDAWMWTYPPGNSSGSCNGGPASGTFWAAKAVALAARANDRLGPNDPSRPY